MGQTPTQRHEVHGVSELLAKAGHLWRYASKEWLRLAMPSDSDSNRSRWPSHPTWEQLTNVDWGDSSPPTQHPVPQERIPSDETLFVRGLWPLSSFMARHGIFDPHEAFAAFLDKANRYHRYTRDLPFDEYLLAKVREKVKRYNTLRNPSPDTLSNGD